MKKLIITTFQEKRNILKKLNEQKELHQCKFMTKNEFFNHYYFSISKEAYSFLMEKYDYKYDVVKKYLTSLYVIDETLEYKSEKLLKLQQIKRELIENNFLIYNPNFKQYIKNKEIEVICYERLEKYEKKLFEEIGARITLLEKKEFCPIVNEANSMDEEILFVIENISRLLKEGISIKNIVLANVDNDYLYSLRKLFTYFNIPINLNINHSIYGTKEVQDYLENKTFNIGYPTEVTKKLINVLNSLVLLKDKPKYEEILVNELKNTNMSNETLEHAVNIIDLEKENISKDLHVFVLGFNLNSLPKTKKDEDYISDNIKNEVTLYTTDEKNKFEYDYTIRLLSNIDHLYLSYKKNSNFNTYYPSNYIDDFNLEVKPYQFSLFHLSDLYNKLLLGQKLDDYYKYKHKDNTLIKLYSHYKNNNYKTYDNVFTGINHDDYLEYINYKLQLSYTSLNNYNLCGFRYYIKHVLKIESFEETFALKLGNIFHEILENMDQDGFDFDITFEQILTNYELDSKEKLFLKNIKEQIKTAIVMIDKQKTYSKYSETYYEKEIIVDLKKANFLDVKFKGKIDKIMYYKKINDAYYSLIDYKTGSVDTTLNNFKYGLSMQLPVYLYLMSKSDVFDSPVFTGFYYQKLLHNKESYKKNVSFDKVSIDRYKLKGYSTDNEELLSEFDSTYHDSEVIQSMKLTSKGFSHYAKVLSDEDVYHLIKYTTKIIDEKSDDIIAAKFIIDPKVIDGDNLSCKYCDFKDLCFVMEKDKQYLEKVMDLSFLGGDVNG